MVESEKGTELIQKAQELKNEGNMLYQAKEYKQAIAKYSKIFLFINGLVSKKDAMAQYSKNLISDENESAISELKYAAYSNMAAAYLALKEYTKAIRKATLALEIKVNSKVLYRRALAYIETGDTDSAKVDLDKANQMQPNDPMIIGAYNKLMQKTEEVLKKEKRKYKGFFDKLDSS
ncbi:hypothetical protein SteCoe_24778 [Stentor coeruleus]|uniref:peptidylprolyl isomerase n=1 Tax=Stentor coeruleus TaxID=5963 RepID=A0A1R2BGV6_9CILI|nr:hypothetical protein SteCoe_24778 [Stentor coeruleus]